LKIRHLKLRVLLWFGFVSSIAFFLISFILYNTLEHSINNKSINSMYEMAEYIEYTLWILVPILLIILIFLVSRVIDKVLNPIKEITKTANEISISDFSSSIEEPTDNDEVREFVRSFNGMIYRLKDGVERMDRFNHDVSHELKTPLTVIKGEVEITLDRPRKSAEYIKSLQIIGEEASQIENMIKSLLFLSKYSKSNIKHSFEFCELDYILFKVLDRYKIQLKNKNINIHLKNIEKIKKKVNPVLIESIFSNLIDNAIKYSNKDKNIYISLFQKEKIRFIIEDEGIGIPKDKIQKLTHRFYRVDESRNRKIKGFGLGLSIVKNSVELHDGTMHIESKEKKGTIVIIDL